MSSQVIFTGLLMYAVLLLSLVFHEFGHAWTALRCGDPTAKNLGRVTLNPLAHADPVGTVLFPLIMIFSGVPLIGWAKPVPFNPANLRHPRRDDMLISGAGPAANLVLAVSAAILMRLVDTMLGFDNVLGAFLGLVLPWIVRINVLLAVFNLIPVMPLDGSWILYHLLPRELATRYQAFGSRWGFIVVLLLLYSGAAWTWIRTTSGLVFPILNALAGTRVGL